MSERVVVFIDGGNLYQRLKESGVFPGKRFDYTRLVERLVHGRTIVGKLYFVGIVRDHDGTPQSKAKVTGQQKFLSQLQLQGFTIERGKIVYDHVIREKGVDVKIAIDLAIGAAEDTFDTAILVSSDTDLVPAIRYVLSKGKKVEYVGFATKPSLGLTKEASLTVLLQQQDVDSLAS